MRIGTFCGDCLKGLPRDIVMANLSFGFDAETADLGTPLRGGSQSVISYIGWSLAVIATNVHLL